MSALGLWPLRFGIGRIDVRLRLAACIGVELVYMWASRTLYDAGLSYADLEIARTPWRLGTAAIQWVLLADVIFGERPRGEPLTGRSLWTYCLLLLLAPVLTEAAGQPVHEGIVVAIASVPVAIHEEIFHRAILQTVLVKRLGAVPGIAIATACFTLYHIGVTSPDTLNFLLIALTGAILGVIYYRTGSLRAVIALHAALDALLCSPWPAPLAPQFGLGLELVMLMSLCGGAGQPLKPPTLGSG